MKQPSFWENPDVVERFVHRKPDHRLVPLLATAPKTWKILDIGCAAGRNTVYMVEHGFDVFALDASEAMVAKTRERLSTFMSETEAKSRVIHGQMQNLSIFADESFDLVVALGVYQDAESFNIWQRAVSESARVLKNGGLCLVAQFAPDHQPHGKKAQAISNQKHVFKGASREDERHLTLLNADDMDREFASFGFMPTTPTEHVRKETEQGFRSTVNGLYQKQA